MFPLRGDSLPALVLGVRMPYTKTHAFLTQCDAGGPVRQGGLGADGTHATVVAVRTPDGHTLIAAATHWLELDVAGKEVWWRRGSRQSGSSGERPPYGKPGRCGGHRAPGRHHPIGARHRLRDIAEFGAGAAAQQPLHVVQELHLTGGCVTALAWSPTGDQLAVGGILGDLVIVDPAAAWWQARLEWRAAGRCR